MWELPPPDPAVWTMHEALCFIRELQPKAMDAGWCLLLGGGVLNKGFSRRDLDILAYPRTTTVQRTELLKLLPEAIKIETIEVADIYTFHVLVPDRPEIHPLELIFQKHPA